MFFTILLSTVTFRCTTPTSKANGFGDYDGDCERDGDGFGDYDGDCERNGNGFGDYDGDCDGDCE